MLLVVDIGNTDIVVGLYKETEPMGQWRIASDIHKTSDEYGVLLTQCLKSKRAPVSRINGMIISSVVPPLTPVFQTLSEQYFDIHPMIVSETVKTGLTIRYEHPGELGSDRIVNAAAAYHLYGGPIIIIDLGTATTFCVVDEGGEYLGGAIAPGMALSAEALVRHTAKLPRVKLTKPESVVGKDTVSSMQSGMYYGYIGLIDEIVKRIHHETGIEARVVATGGLAPLIAPACQSISKIRPTLTLEGLMIIYSMNSSA